MTLSKFSLTDQTCDSKMTWVQITFPPATLLNGIPKLLQFHGSKN